MLTTSLYTNIAFFILFQHPFSVLLLLSAEVSAIPSGTITTVTTTEDASNSASQLVDQVLLVHDDPSVASVGHSEVDGAAAGSGIGQRLPVFPERTDAVYFVVAVVGGAKMWGRMLAKTLQDLGPPFNNPHGPPLRPIYVDMPQNGRFSSKVLTMFCQQTENRPLAGVIVIGEGQSARAIALAGTAMKLPVLWAKGGTASLNGKHKEIETPLQAMLQPSAKEILEAVRAIFLQTHWHSFFVMSDMESSMILKSSEGSSLHQAPLQPTILPLPARNGNIFKQLAEISKSTRGVVLLLCNLETARKIMSEAQRLNMVGGHFIWLWADTSSTTEFYDTAASSSSPVGSLRGGGGASWKGKVNGNVPIGSPQSSGSRDKSRMPVVTSSSGASMGRQRENDQRGATSAASGRNRKQGGGDGRRENTDNKDSPKRERFHLPVAGRSRPVSEPNDKSRSRRDLANPTVASASFSSHELRNEHDDTAAGGGGGDNQFYDYDGDEELNSDNQQWEGEKEEDDNTSGDVESERRILELLRKAAPPPAKEERLSESIRLAKDEDLVVDDKWGTGNRLSSTDPAASSYSSTPPSKSSLSDIDPVIKFGAAATEDKEGDEEVSKLKRTLNWATANNSDVLFHHFKDFPVGLLALRPVRMAVDRHFIRATVQLFANTWKHVERMGQQSRSWRRRRRRREANNSDRLEVMKGASVDEKLRESVVNITVDQLNQSFNASDLGKHLKDRQRREGLHESNDNSSGEEEGDGYNNGGSNSTNDVPVQGTHLASKASQQEAASRVDADEQQLIETHDEHDQLEESDLYADYSNIIKSSASGSYLKSQEIARLAGGSEEVEEGVVGASEDIMSNNMQIKTKRKHGVSEQQEEVKGRAGATQRQQVLGAWTKTATASRVGNSNYSGGRRQLGSPQYSGGCYGTPNKGDVRRAESFASLLRRNTQLVLEGMPLMDGGIIEKSLITQFELLNLVPMNIKQQPHNPSSSDTDSVSSGANKSGLTKWRRVGLISGTRVHLDTIVWPGGDIVVSGLSARPRSVFRVVTALAPPFVMESELDEDGLCLRGLPCHRLLPTSQHNLTQIFNAIETRGRLEQDAIEHGWEVPDSAEDMPNPSYKTKCCYGLSMDLLENVATELGFQFHLYLVRDELYGAKYSALTNGQSSNLQSSEGGGGGEGVDASEDSTTTGGQMAQRQSNSYGDVEIESDWDQANADADKKYFMSEDKIFGQKNPHIFYKLDAEGKRTQFNRDFAYMTERRLREQAKNEDRQRSPKEGAAALPSPPVAVQSTKWNGIIGDLIIGSADMSFAALSVSKSRAEAIDFSAPYFHSGVSLLAAPQTKSEIPLLAFLLPFSPELWIAIFTSLNITAVAVAIYEWLSPFGLNPWGRQRNKNFSMSSALWVMWGLLCGHLVAFKAPKSWPNKFLINVWGGFSVIFVASYTANIAALIAGLFFQNAARKYEASLYTQRVGTPKASVAEMYLQKNDRHLWEHMKKYKLQSLDEGITRLKNGSLDLLMADSPILDYYRATDSGCNLQRIGETYVEDAYAIGMTKGFPLKDSISELIAKYSSNGYLDILTEKWYGGLPCFKLDAEIVQPRPLELSALAGVYLLLGMGMILGILILIFEHWFYKYTLPILRHKPNGTVWKSPNIMFFSQKLYRFINCVELVSPHHAARELVHSIRQGQIASLFQKSIKRKEDEQRRRRKSKAQFFEMIQEIRRINFLSRIQQQHEPPISEADPSLELHAILSPDKLKVSPKPKGGFRKDSRSRSRSNSSGLNVRRFSTDSILAVRLDTIGRRLSRDITNSPPDLGHRFDRRDTLPLSRQGSASAEMLTERGASSPHLNGNSSIPSTTKRTPLHLDVCYDRERERKRSADNIEIMPTLRERLAPPICRIEPERAELKDRLHDELKSKYAPEKVTKPPRRPVSTVTDQMPPKIKVVRPDSLECGGSGSGNTSAMVVGMTPKVRPTPSPRHVTICTEAPDQTVPSGGTVKRNGKSKLTREELQRIQSGSQAEIDVYLQKSLRQRLAAEPP